MENQEQTTIKASEIKFITPEGGFLFNYIPAQFIASHYEVIGQVEVNGKVENINITLPEGINRIPNFDTIENQDLKNILIDLWQTPVQNTQDQTN